MKDIIFNPSLVWPGAKSVWIDSYLGEESFSLFGNIIYLIHVPADKLCRAVDIPEPLGGWPEINGKKVCVAFVNGGSIKWLPDGDAGEEL